MNLAPTPCQLKIPRILGPSRRDGPLGVACQPAQWHPSCDPRAARRPAEFSVPDLGRAAAATLTARRGFPMNRCTGLTAAFGLGFLMSCLVLTVRSQEPGAKDKKARDPAAEATAPGKASGDRPELRQSAHDKSDVFDPKNAMPINPALKAQPKEGKTLGFDFARDPLNSDKPMTPFAEVMKMESEQKPKVMAAHRKLLESRYNLTPKRDENVKMSRGKPLCVGPTARLAEGLGWDKLAGMSPADIKKQDAFPYPSLPHPLHTNGGQVFPQVQTAMFPRLERF